MVRRSVQFRQGPHVNINLEYVQDMVPDVSQYIKELGYTPKQTISILKTVSRLISKKITIKRVKNLKQLLESGAPIIVSYPDQLISSNESSINALDHFLDTYFYNIPVYILPCWETTGDGGFSIKNFVKPRRQVGSISELTSFCNKKVVCMDMVLSNVSIEHKIVKHHISAQYSECNSIVAEFVGKNPQSIPMSHRGHPNVRKFASKHGERWLWTTFSPHQVNLNYSSPKTLIWLLKTIAFYLDIGASSIRLDAVPFLWTTGSGSMIHAPQCHSLVKIVRSFINFYKPGTLLIAQTDYATKPLHDYIGHNDNEAHLLYRHELAPILIHGIISGQKKYIEKWIYSLNDEPDRKWISFLSTCDGLFLRPWNYPLPDGEIRLLMDACVSGGGVVQYYNWENRPPATLCTTTYSILSYLVNKKIAEQRVLLANAMLLALPGVPALFFNSIFGFENWKDWETNDTDARSLVRERYSAEQIDQLLTANTRQYRLYKKLKKLINIRIKHRAACQNSQAKIITGLPKEIIAWSLSYNGATISCYFNLSNIPKTIPISRSALNVAGDPIINGKIKLSSLSYSWIEISKNS